VIPFHCPLLAHDDDSDDDNVDDDTGFRIEKADWTCLQTRVQPCSSGMPNDSGGLPLPPSATCNLCGDIDPPVYRDISPMVIRISKVGKEFIHEHYACLDTKTEASRSWLVQRPLR